MKILRNKKEKNSLNSKAYKIISFVILSISLLLLSLSFNYKVNAAISNTINFQTKIIVKSTGLNVTSGTPPTCVVAGADTCDFRVRIWNQISGGTATAGNNLMYEELFNNVELGDTNGIFNLIINSICGATVNGTHAWGTTVTSATICNLFDDNGDVDSTTGVNFDRTDLYLEITFDPSGAWTTLASPPGGIETFARNSMTSVPSAFTTQLLNGVDETGYVQLSPSSVQNTNSSTGAIRVNQTGSGDILKLERTVGGQNALSLNNAGQLNVGSTNGIILLGGDSSIFRNTSTSIRTDSNFVMDGTSNTQLTALGFTNLKGNARAIVTVSNGSTTTTGTGSSVTALTLTSTTGFDVGNLVLINGTTYAVITSVDTSTILSVDPTVTWSAGQTVVEYTAPKIGGDGTSASLMFDRLSAQLGLRVGTSTNSTTYQDQLITTGKSNSLAIDSTTTDINSTSSTVINTNRGLIINKTEGVNVAQSWSSLPTAITPRSAMTAVNYNGKAYIYGGQNGSTIYDTLESYDYATDTWRALASSGSQRTQHSAVVYNDKMYVWGGYNGVPSIVNTMDVYDFATNTWASGTAGGTARAEPSGVVYKDKMYVWAAPSTNFDVYDFAAGSWSSLTTTSGTAPNGGSIEVYNDKIYLYGGDGSNYNRLYSFDFRTNAWTQLASSSVEKIGHTTAIFNNKLYAFGGIDSGGTYQNTVGIYDFGTNTWSTGVTGGTAKRFFYTTVYNGKAYNFLGMNVSGVVSGIDIYDFGINDTVLTFTAGGQDKLSINQNNVMTLTTQPLGLKYIANDINDYSSIAWTTGTSGGTARAFSQSVEYNGKIYIWGGGTSSAHTALTNTLDIYDIKLNSWTTGAAGGTAKWGSNGVSYNGRIYFVGGCTTTGTACGTVTNVVEIYNIANNSWTTGTAGGTARGLGVAVQSNGKIYSYGGYTGAANLNTLDIYDIAANSWTTGTAGGTARRIMSATLYRNKMYVFGGFNGTVNITNLDIYDIQTNSWQTGTALTTARRAMGSVAYNDKIYIIHGVTTAGVNSADVYDIRTNTWAAGLAGGQTNSSQATAVYGNKAYIWGGNNTTSTAVTNVMDILEFGTSKAEDILYMSNVNGISQEDGKLFRFDSTGRAYTSKQGGWYSVGADYAEYMHTFDIGIEAGDIVKLDPNDGTSVLKAEVGGNFLGVISTDPGFVGNITSVEDINRQRSDMKLLSMVGQVPVKVTGEVNVGDRITISEIEGVGKKAGEGEDTLGIAQEPHEGDGIDKISVLITRNNEGINNKVQIKMGEKGEQGFRLSSVGRLQFKDSTEDWKDISSAITTDESVIWKKLGDNIYSNNIGSTSIGIDQPLPSSTKLQVGGDIEVKDGLKFIKVSANTQSITFSNSDIGFRLNNSNLQFRDEKTGEWRSLNGLVQSNSKQNPNGSIDVIYNSEQVSGWGVLKGDGISSSLSKIMSFGKIFTNVPVVIVDSAGSSLNEPNSLNDCQFDNSIVTMTPYSIDSSKFNLNIKIDSPSNSNKYYCYSWKALGN